MQKQIIYAFLLLSFAIPLSAQEVKWQRDLKEELYNVSWIEQANEGTIIASGDKGLVGLNNQTGAIAWQHADLKAIDRSTFHALENLPYFQVETTNLVGKSRALLIDASSGKILFDSKEENLKIGAHHLMPALSGIIFELKQESRNKLMFFDYSKNEKRWMTDISEASGGLTSVVKKSLGLTSFLSYAPQLAGNDRILIGEKEKVYMLGLADGKVIWSQEMDDKLNALLYVESDKKVYAGIKKKLMVMDGATGKDLTDGKMKIGSSLEQIYPNKAGQLVIVAADGFNLLNPATGSLVWKKSHALEGLSQVLEVGDDYYAVGGFEKGSVISRVSKDGERVWKENVDGFAYYFKPIEKGIFYLSTEKSNIISYDGEKLWKKDIRFKSIPAVDVDLKNKEVVFYEDNTLHRFNLESGNIETLNEDIKLEKVKDFTANLQVRPDGYLIYTPQHTAFVDKKGGIRYNLYYPPLVTFGGFASVAQFGANIAGVDVDIKGNLETIKSLDKLSHGSLKSSGDQNEGTTKESVAAGLYSNNQPLYEITKKRFSNSKQIKDHAFIVTGDDTGSRIVMVNKDSGKVEKAIPLKDKSPSYLIDVIDNRVFLNENNKLISCYQM
ncbi:MAG: PQQ-binding-like beta-propeller repeat protein [Saprospiraceae bacterium]|nr:PQQ-binding-like beta-propeller repeat protein [Saprospiraceae bacterium]